MTLALDNAPITQAAAERKPVRCRTLGPDDVPEVVRLLQEGFPERPARYWEAGLQRLAARPSPAGRPRFGYVLDHGGEIVGVLLTIYSEVEDESGTHTRCNLSSWYVDPRFRGFGVLLDMVAMKDRAVTYLNASPAPHTLPMHKARGFQEHGRGQLMAIPALSRARAGQRIEAFSAGRDQGLSTRERALALEHLAYGCMCFVCSDDTGARLAVFVRRTLPLMADKAPRLRIPCWQLVYGPTGSAFADWAGTLGRHLLLRRAMPLVLVDFDERLPGVRGRYFGGRKPRVIRGPQKARVGDLSATEVVVFGP